MIRLTGDGDGGSKLIKPDTGEIWAIPYRLPCFNFPASEDCGIPPTE